MTGLAARVRGFSFAMESRVALFTMGGSKRGRECASLFGSSSVSSATGGATRVPIDSAPNRERNHREEFSLLHQEVLDDGPEGQRREVGQRSHDDHRANQQADKQRPMRGQR